MGILVTGYHGTSQTVARLVTAGGIQHFKHSANTYDWLGKGIYFWQDAPVRAAEWAQRHHPNEPAVLVATIDLGMCIDLLDSVWMSHLARSHTSYAKHCAALSIPIPAQTPDKHPLDRSVLNHAVTLLASKRLRIDSVRGIFQEGNPVYPNAAIYDQAHIQIAVRSRAAITSISLRP